MTSMRAISRCFCCSSALISLDLLVELGDLGLEVLVALVLVVDRRAHLQADENAISAAATARRARPTTNSWRLRLRSPRAREVG